MSVAIAAFLPTAPVPPQALADDVVNDALSKTTPNETVLAAHAAIVQAAQNGDQVDTVALAKIVGSIGEGTEDLVSRDILMAHAFLLVAFYHQLQCHESEAKDLNVGCFSLL
ncbi:hypothetical protein GGF32_002753 [Allomyces javanicus]|nr:hypothetical protein GGF32_002753 [Allomyces javanicus]